MSLRALLAACVAAASLAAAGEDVVAPPPNLVLDGVPPIPASLARALAPYNDFRPVGLLSWHPVEREMLVRRRLEATTQVHHLATPGAAARPVTDLPEAVTSASYEPTKGEFFVFAIGRGGDEVYRLHRFDVATGAITALSPARQRAGSMAWTRDGSRIAYLTRPVGPGAVDAITFVHVQDPRDPDTDRVVAELPGGGWFGLAFSEDGRRLAMTEYISAAESHLWVMDVAAGKKRRVTTPRKGERVSYAKPRFSKDGRSLFALSDRGAEFRRLVTIALPGGRERALTAHIPHDVDDYDIGFEAGMLAFTTNERGSHGLRFLELKTLKEQPRPSLVDGVIGGLEWRPRTYEVGFHLASARSPGDVFSYHVRDNRLTRWTPVHNPGLDMAGFAEPRLVQWPSFDGRAISGFLYAPPPRFTGRRPVIVNVHGGPEAQARAGFIGRNNYFVSELGIAVLYPNVRGSTGFGKTFARLDDGRRREDAVRDIGALLDWIAAQPGLDPGRVLVAGGSYGGYMSLASSFHHAGRIAGAMSVVGISNFVTFLERTETYRRDLRRAEYGDERDPEMRAFLESISPLRHVERMTKPLFIVQGRNDPRVPHTEAEQIAAALKARGTPAWFMMARDEGHGFAKKPNADYQFFAFVEFARRVLLGP